MNSDLAQIAINCALKGNWKEAVVANRKILKDNPKDVDALNRLAKAYAELGNFKRAKVTAEKVLKIDTFNTIASKSLSKWRNLTTTDTLASSLADPEDFLEEPGKTKIVSLLHLGDTTVLCKLYSGDKLKIIPHGHRVSIVTVDGKYIGRLTDDLAARLRKLIKLGNEYEAFVKSVAPEDVKVFIRETKRAKGAENFPSFSVDKIEYISFTPPELIHEKGGPPIFQPEEES